MADRLTEPKMRGDQMADGGVKLIWNGGETRAARLAKCTECGQISGVYWVRWRVYRVDDPETGSAPEIALYCPKCADREFGPPRRRPMNERRQCPREVGE